MRSRPRPVTIESRTSHPNTAQPGPIKRRQLNKRRQLKERRQLTEESR